MPLPSACDAPAFALPVRSRMKNLWEAIQRGYLRVIAPVADWMVARRINPNAITTVGTLCSMIAGAIYASGHIMTER